MRFLSVTALLLLIAAPAVSLAAEAVQQIEWRDLTVPIDVTDDPYYGLSLEQRNSLDTLLALQRKRQADDHLSEADTVTEKLALSHLASEKLDGYALLSKEAKFRDKLSRQRTSVREDWDDHDVKVPGYLVPLEYDGSQVVEFILVPYAGACIHTPPPPANQMVLVRFKKGFSLTELFSPVWVTGRLTIDRSEQSVALSDGAAAFEVSYMLDAIQVVEYQ